MAPATVSLGACWVARSVDFVAAEVRAMRCESEESFRPAFWRALREAAQVVLAVPDLAWQRDRLCAAVTTALSVWRYWAL